jgi:hypothetical protein
MGFASSSAIKIVPERKQCYHANPMPKPISLDPDRKKKRKRKKRKVDYTVYLLPPLVPEQQCTHTTKPMEASDCSQCMAVTPSVVKKPPPTDWWADTDDLIEEISIEEFEGDDNGVDNVYIELVDDDPML